LLLKDGSLATLNTAKDAQISDWLVRVQAACRAKLARSKARNLKRKIAGTSGMETSQNGENWGMSETGKLVASQNRGNLGMSNPAELGTSQNRGKWAESEPGEMDRLQVRLLFLFLFIYVFYIFIFFNFLNDIYLNIIKLGISTFFIFTPF